MQHEGIVLQLESWRNAPALYAFNMPEIFVVQKYEGIPDLLYHQYASEEILALN